MPGVRAASEISRFLRTGLVGLRWKTERRQHERFWSKSSLGQDGSVCKGPEAAKGLRDLRMRKKADGRKLGDRVQELECIGEMIGKSSPWRARWKVPGLCRHGVTTLYWDMNMNCPPWAHVFEPLVPSWWCCLGRLQNLQDGEPHGGSRFPGVCLEVFWQGLTSWLGMLWDHLTSHSCVFPTIVDLCTLELWAWVTESFLKQLLVSCHTNKKVTTILNLATTVGSKVDDLQTNVCAAVFATICGGLD